MNPALNALPLLCAGQSISCPETRSFGRIGLLAKTRTGDVLAITTLAVVGAGKCAAVDADGRVLLGPSSPLATPDDEDHPPVSAMLATLTLGTDVRASALFLGLDAIGKTIAPRAAVDRMLHLADGGRSRSIGRLTSINASVRRADGACFFGAAEIALTTDSAIGPGDAGAAIATGNGHLLGILIGRRNGRALVAPVRDILTEWAITPLTAFDASRHESAVQDAMAKLEMERLRKSEQDKAYDPRLDRDPRHVGMASADILKRHRELLEIA